ncbi:3-phenylpropionate MFS transporter [Motilimonas pumila]|uniref:3-phenylpropionate MFS transporter n=1 Tax=Motilimonas pumila TaxID=2303987 RepID=A0A418YFE3_9GAMM|nr:3-phenylpropionate MFS transporter [Motilimonas pumila]RJG47859.1 3-phenylpropionate MFS transporter [Motilimonas pumila]
MHRFKANHWLATFFASFFFCWGIFLPFWPLWLEQEGLDPGLVGTVLGVALFLRCLSSLWLVNRVQRESQLIIAIRWLCLLTLGVFALFLAFNGWYWLAGLTLLANFIIAPLIPLGDAVATRWVKQIGLDYGKVRLWGSISFIVAAIATGWLSEQYGHHVILYTLLFALLLTFSVAILNPTPALTDSQQTNTVRASLWQVCRLPGLWQFLLVTSCIQGSHGAYYTYSAIYWQSAGIPETVIGYLWAFAVVAEVLLMANAKRWFANVTLPKLFMLAATGAVIRWTVLALSTDVTVLFLSQALHAFTFALAQIAAIRFIAEKAPAAYSIQLQALYSALALGLAIALATLVSSSLYQAWQGNVFWLMALMVLPVFVIYGRASSNS